MDLKEYLKSTKEKNYFMLYKWLVKRKELTPADKLVWSAIGSWANSGKDCHQSINSLSAATGIAEKSVRNALQRLDKQALIRITKRAGSTSILTALVRLDWMDEDSKAEPDQPEQQETTEKPAKTIKNRNAWVFYPEGLEMLREVKDKALDEAIIQAVSADYVYSTYMKSINLIWGYKMQDNKDLSLVRISLKMDTHFGVIWTADGAQRRSVFSKS